MIQVKHLHQFKPFNMATKFPNRELAIEYMNSVERLGFKTGGRFIGSEFDVLVLIPEDGLHWINSVKISNIHKEIKKQYRSGLVDEKRDRVMQIKASGREFY